MGKNPAQGAGIPFLRLKVSLWSSFGRGEVTPHELTMPVGTTVDELLGHLSGLVGQDLRVEIGSGQARFLAINGAPCVMPRDLTRKLQDGDAVALLPFIAGG
jgi:molybdopterin converting factor small subunit